MSSIPVIDMEKTGANIKQLREAAGISVRDLQDVMGFSTPQAIYKWQHGDSLPTIDNMLVLAALFSVSIEQILITHDIPA